jgi:hypothetical protein
MYWQRENPASTMKQTPVNLPIDSNFTGSAIPGNAKILEHNIFLYLVGYNAV